VPVVADVLELAVHHSIIVVDVEGFGARHRTRADQGAIRHGLYQALQSAFTRSQVSWDDCYHEDRGDGVLILVPPQVPKATLAAGVPGELAAAVDAHNEVHDPNARMRLRLALHGGEVAHDAYGVTGTAVNLAFRLLEAGQLKQALAGSPGVLAVIASAWFYEEVVRHTEACAPATWRRVLVTVKETREDGWISLPDAPYPAHPDAVLPAVPAATAEVRYSLPPDTAAFTGRGEELDQITAAVTGAAGTGGVVAVRAIDGMPGVGKTALAVHVAHALSGRFPDRQLFIDLHAHTPGREPVVAEDALAGLLTAAGVDPRFLPDGLDGRAAVWRDRMVGQRALLVLDNASSSAQVAPLLPGGETCLVLVTSRRHLGDLPGVTVPVLLDVLPGGQAAEMFIRLAPRAAADPAGVAEVVRLAGFLPLAISLLAHVFVRHLVWTLADLAADTRAGLLTVTAENSSIAAAFELSYRYLDPVLQRFFDLLGLHPGGTTDSYAAAALAGVSPTEADRLLDALHGEGLLTETGYRRYGMHDLLRRFARDHAAAGPGTGQALGRLLDYYLHTAALAQDRLARQTRPGPPPATLPTAPAAAPVLEDAGQALAWARAERDSLLACLDHVTRDSQHARVIALTAALAELLRRDGPWTEAVTRHITALQSARHLGDRLGQAGALTDLGTVRGLTSDYPGAAGDLEQALAIYRDLGDRLGQASALNILGAGRGLTSDYQGAARDLEQALAIYRDLGDRLGQARSLNNLSAVRRGTGDYQGAAGDLEQALAIYRDLGDRLGQASALLYLGTVRYLTGDYPGAAGDLEQALAISRDLGDRLGQANALLYLGTVRYLTGDYPGAAGDLEQALAIYRDLGNRLGQASALCYLGTVRRLTGDYPGSAGDLEQALAIFRDLGSQPGQANTLTSLGTVRRLTGDYPGSAGDLEQALAIYRDLGDRGGEAEVLNETGTLQRLSGEPAKAKASHRQALELARAIGSALDEAHALAGLGRCAAAAGHTRRAKALLRQAHVIFQRIGAADAPAVLAELNALTSPGPRE
jgi:tetratricopeptide (TPR) repeat protein